MRFQAATLIAFVSASGALAGVVQTAIRNAKGGSPAGHPAPLKGKTALKARQVGHVHDHAFGGIPKHNPRSQLESRSPHGVGGGSGGRGGGRRGGGQGAVQARNYGGPRHGGGGYRHHHQQQQPTSDGSDNQAVEARNYGGHGGHGHRHGGHRQQQPSEDPSQEQSVEERGLGELEIDELD